MRLRQRIPHYVKIIRVRVPVSLFEGIIWSAKYVTSVLDMRRRQETKHEKRSDSQILPCNQYYLPHPSSLLAFVLHQVNLHHSSIIPQATRTTNSYLASMAVHIRGDHGAGSCWTWVNQFCHVSYRCMQQKMRPKEDSSKYLPSPRFAFPSTLRLPY